MESANEMIANLQGLKLEETLGRFEGQEIPSSFSEEIKHMRFLDEEESGEEEEDPRMGEAAQLTMRELQEREEARKAAEGSIPECWEEEPLSPIEEANEAIKKGAEEVPVVENLEQWAKEELPTIMKDELLKAAERLAEEQLHVPHNRFETLMADVISHGITLSEKETSTLRRKAESLGGISLREAVMFVEGLRAANTISEAKIAGHLESFTRVLEQYRAQIRMLERSISDVKAQEKQHMANMAAVESQKADMIAQIDHQCKNYYAKQRQEVMEWRKQEEAKAIEEIKLYKDHHKRKGKSVSHTEPVKRKAEDAPQKTVKLSPPPPPPFPFEAYVTQEDAESEAAGACAALLIIADNEGFTVGGMCSWYKLDVEEMNKLLTKLPATREGLMLQFGSLSNAYMELNRILATETSRRGLDVGY
ncbi:TPA_asm: protein 2 [Abies virus 1]|uniref:Protein 2 n=1 Tax=Abies virus 1 TaxID=2977948 RepID=A0A9N7AAS5_9RHAB|nr:TPA_asm: protein 2 [Abies virus 1]